MFDTHILNEQGMAEMQVYKTLLADAAKSVLTMMPEGREKSIFVTKMEEAVFFGAKAIAQKQFNFDSKTEF